MPTPVRVVQYGLGPIGLACIQTLLEKSKNGAIALVGAIDIDPDKIGQDVGALLPHPLETGIRVSGDAQALLSTERPDVVLHTTSSFLDRMHEQLRLCAAAGAHVISSTEELSFPFDRHPALAAALDATAKQHGTVMLGTGVNPGYAMDTLALMATGVCTEVHKIRVERVVDAGKRRGPLQRKVGAGITAEAFAARKATGTFGHIGLRESLLMVADGLGWDVEDLDETLEPVLATRAIHTPHASVDAGQVAGIHHAITASRGGSVVLSLDLKMYVGAHDPRDAVWVEGTPPIDLLVRGGIFGDTATVATLVNAIPLVQQAPPGLRTMKDVPVPRAYATALAVPAP